MVTPRRKGRYSKKAKYRHDRRVHPREFKKGTLRTVPISHTNARKRYPKGTKAIVGKKKRTGNWAIQSVLTPKKR